MRTRTLSCCLDEYLVWSCHELGPWRNYLGVPKSQEPGDRVVSPTLVRGTYANGNLHLCLVLWNFGSSLKTSGATALMKTADARGWA